jgi:hypothetical protein
MDVIVTLTSDDESEVTVPATVTIPANQTQATFTVTPMDDTELDGDRPVSVTASSPICKADSTSLTVTDNEVGTLTFVILLEQTTESGGSIHDLAWVTVDQAPTYPMTVTLSSDDTSEATCSATVVIPADSTKSELIDLAAIDDDAIDGPQTVTFTAHVDRWNDGTDTLVVLDDEDTNLVLTMPGAAREGDGELAERGTVSISGTLEIDLLVTLRATPPRSSR